MFYSNKKVDKHRSLYDVIYRAVLLSDWHLTWTEQWKLTVETRINMWLIRPGISILDHGNSADHRQAFVVACSNHQKHFIVTASSSLVCSLRGVAGDVATSGECKKLFSGVTSAKTQRIPRPPPVKWRDFTDFLCSKIWTEKRSKTDQLQIFITATQRNDNCLVWTPFVLPKFSYKIRIYTHNDFRYRELDWNSETRTDRIVTFIDFWTLKS